MNMTHKPKLVLGVRGGAWDFKYHSLCSAYQASSDSNSRFDIIGFRITLKRMVRGQK